ncbi:MAG: HAD-IIIC family phosphatase [Rhodoferax sp.]|nr:HAD-IIIC family phosphatase [Rhodoferax sp.]
MSEATELLAQLAAPGLTLTRTLGTIEALEKQLSNPRRIKLGISANVSVDLLSVFLRKHALLAGVGADIVMGNHDDPLTDVDLFLAASVEQMIFLPFFDNLIPAFESCIELMSAEDIAAKEDDLRARWRLVFEHAKPMRQIYACAMHRTTTLVDMGVADSVDSVIDRLNAMLRKEAAVFANVRVVDTRSIVHEIGAEAAFDRRFYLRNTAPYATPFLNELARRVVLSARGFGGWFYKALVLDCDNTLWGGIIGEDLTNGIQLDPHSYPGRVFWRVQQEFLTLEQHGVLLCLCSKNNPQDVDEILEKHAFTVLRKEHLALRKVNWIDKVSNLRAISQELNIGLDSLVFIDDSDFECNAVRSALPMVRVFQVPNKTLSDYPRMVREIRELFLSGGVLADSRSKTAQYRQRQEAAEASMQFATHEEYLASLGIHVHLARDDVTSLARISELTQKSNQFNLTTLRQSPSDIQQRMNSERDTVYSLTVSDRFGNAGLTGVALVCFDGEVARVDAFLISCRVIGRSIEFCFWPHVAYDARCQGCHFIEAEYRPTAKNAQVADFYDRLGLPLISENNGVKHYRASLADFNPPTIDWINLTK